MRRVLLSVLIAPVLLHLVGAPIYAQSPASVAGRVSDQRGAAIAGGVVAIWQRDTGFARPLATNAAGSFQFYDLF